jgi:outer membrane biosynthesis protein TonB
MNELLQEAIHATRNGQKREAQLLLAKNLKENPEDVQSWYLLGMLVDSREKQALYLNKALTLDPAHEKAQERLVALQTAPTFAISEEPLDFLSQSEGDSLPDWLASDADSLQLEKMGTRTAVVEEETAVTPEQLEMTTPTTKAVPDWLQNEVSPAWVTQEPPTQVSPFPQVQEEKPKPKPRPQPTQKAAQPPAKPRQKAPAKRPRSKEEQTSRLNVAMAGLIFIMILVFLALLYQVYLTFF